MDWITAEIGGLGFPEWRSAKQPSWSILPACFHADRRRLSLGFEAQVPDAQANLQALLGGCPAAWFLARLALFRSILAEPLI